MADMTKSRTVSSIEPDLHAVEAHSSAEIRHPLNQKDEEVIAALSAQIAPLKGKLDGPHARGMFDDVMEHTPDAAGVRYEEGAVGGVRGIWCRPQSPRPGVVLQHLHGGGYVLGSAHAYRHFVGQIAARANVSAFVADYRLAPEHTFPAAVDDARAVYRGIAEQGARRIVITGDSAGGGLALVLLAAAHAEAASGRGLAPSGAAVMSPWTDLTLAGASLQSRADDDPLNTKEMLAAMAAAYLRTQDASAALASPLEGTLTGLPPIQLHVGTRDVLLDDTLRYVTRARKAGVDATAHVWEGMTHVFQSSVGSLDAADRSLNIMAGFLTAWTD
jgi:epsilon-lactone hydrolase